MEGFLTLLLSMILLVFHAAITYRLKSNRLMSKREIRILNIILALMLIGYIVAHDLLLNVYAIEEGRSKAYEVILSTSLLFFVPYFWVSMLYFLNKIFMFTRINKKAKIKGEFTYYRDDLSKTPPSLTSFVYKLKVDVHKDISATLLKLKLEGHVKENDGLLYCTDKERGGLLGSEKLLLDAIRSKNFNVGKYTDTVKQEAKSLNLLKQVDDSAFKKMLKICSNFLFAILAVAVVLGSAIAVGNVWDEKYPLRTVNGVHYIKVEKDVYDEYGMRLEKELEELSALQRINIRMTYMQEGLLVNTNAIGDYLVRADKLDGYVKWDNLVLLVIGLLMILCALTVIITISLIITQIKCFRDNYVRTLKGTKLVNEAYGLKNFLEDFSMIKSRTEEDLVLWEYYLVYAVVLDVNVGIDDKGIRKFIDSMIPC